MRSKAADGGPSGGRLAFWVPLGLAVASGGVLALLLTLLRAETLEVCADGLDLWNRHATIAAAGWLAGAAVLAYLAHLTLRLRRQRPLRSPAAAGPAMPPDSMPAALDHAVDGTIVVDQAGHIVGFSKPAERIFGYRADEVTGRNVSMLMPEPYRSAHEGYIETYLRTGVANILGFGREVPGQRKDGSVFPMDLAVGEMPAADGRHFVGTVRDISRRKATEDQLRQSSKMEAVGLLTGGIAHDFNNLLSVMLGNLQLVSEASSAEARPPLDSARRAAERAADMTRRLLSFSRRQALLPRPVDINRLVAGMTDELRRTAGDGIAVGIELDGEPLAAEVDPQPLADALLSLVVNAREAMPQGGALSIATGSAVVEEALGYGGAEADARPGAYRTIAVSDTGRGMTPNIRARVFEPFFTTKEIGTGSGLGLSMVYGFAKQSGGHVAIDSEPGRGTTVRLYLPVATAVQEPAAAAESMAAAAAANAASGRGQAVLLVEDDEDVRPLVALMLERLGYAPIQAADAREALAVLETETVLAAMLTDVVMPKGMDGLALAAAARAKRPQMPVVFITGYSHQTAELVDAVRAGATLLSKPFTPAELGQALAAATRGPRDGAGGGPPAARPSQG